MLGKSRACWIPRWQAKAIPRATCFRQSSSKFVPCRFLLFLLFLFLWGFRGFRFFLCLGDARGTGFYRVPRILWSTTLFAFVFLLLFLQWSLWLLPLPLISGACIIIVIGGQDVLPALVCSTGSYLLGLLVPVDLDTEPPLLFWVQSRIHRLRLSPGACEGSPGGRLPPGPQPAMVARLDDGLGPHFCRSSRRSDSSWIRWAAWISGDVQLLSTGSGPVWRVDVGLMGVLVCWGAPKPLVTTWGLPTPQPQQFPYHPSPYSGQSCGAATKAGLAGTMIQSCRRYPDWALQWYFRIGCWAHMWLPAFALDLCSLGASRMGFVIVNGSRRMAPRIPSWRRRVESQHQKACVLGALELRMERSSLPECWAISRDDLADTLPQASAGHVIGVWNRVDSEQPYGIKPSCTSPCFNCTWS